MAKTFEELRQAYKELLADNQQLIADNRKLRQEVTELKQLNDGYVKIIAKNQETNNKLMASVQKQTGSDYISRADAIEAVEKNFIRIDQIPICTEIRKAIIRLLKALPSADAVPQLRQTDTLIIADALRYLAKDTERHLVDRTRADALRQQFLKYGASMCKGGDEE